MVALRQHLCERRAPAAPVAVPGAGWDTHNGEKGDPRPGSLPRDPLWLAGTAAPRLSWDGGGAAGPGSIIQGQGGGTEEGEGCRATGPPRCWSHAVRGRGWGLEVSSAREMNMGVIC